MSLLKKLDEIEAAVRRADTVRAEKRYDLSRPPEYMNLKSETLSLVLALRLAMDAMYDSIAKADDCGDSYNSKPIRDAVKAITQLGLGEGGE